MNESISYAELLMSGMMNIENQLTVLITLMVQRQSYEIGLMDDEEYRGLVEKSVAMLKKLNEELLAVQTSGTVKRKEEGET